MALGRADRQGDLFDDGLRFCERSLSENSIYRFLAWERERLFPDELFADLFCERGRRSVPPSVVATVMVLQRLEGLSDRDAVDRYAFDVRWRYAAGVGGHGGADLPREERRSGGRALAQSGPAAEDLDPDQKGGDVVCAGLHGRGRGHAAECVDEPGRGRGRPRA